MGTFPQKIKTRVYLYLSSLIDKSKDGCVKIEYDQHCDKLGLDKWDLEKVLCELDYDGSIRILRSKTGAVVESTLSHNKPDRCK